ncbi:conserved protein, unknown function [Hepatocystis sp. ex Piliocolobus tephrosceles]|nr:conserved protein, unknown function [Hepatocystis sp. ex Piliocolobus tephrosceles]
MNNFIFLFFFLFLQLTYAQLPYEVQNIYKAINAHSVIAMPGDKSAEEVIINNNNGNIQKDYSEHSLKKLADKYYKDIEGSNQGILEELNQLIDIVNDKSLYLTIF